MNKILFLIGSIFLTQICIANVQQDINYDLSLTFQKNKSVFQGHVVIDVKLKDTFESLNFSFMGNINSIVINNQSLKDINSNGHSFSIPKNHLSKENKIAISFVGTFDNNQISQTAIRKDEFAIFTGTSHGQKNQIFPVIANQTLPSKIKLKITGPKNWEAVTNTLKDSETYLKETKTIRFKETEKIELNTFQFVFGDLQVQSQFHNEISLNIYHTRKNSKNEFNDIFNQIKSSIDYFNTYTGKNLPLKKIDFVLLPFNIPPLTEGMGIFIFKENIFFREQHSPNSLDLKNYYLTSSILKSWNNIPEGFVNFLTNQFNKKNYDISTLPLKRIGYLQKWNDLTKKDEYKNQFSLLQLYLLVGESSFNKAINYHITNKIKEEDILLSFKPFTRIDLGKWEKEWHKSVGTNKAQISFSCSNGKINHFKIIQSPNDSGLLQTHTTTIGLFSYTNDKLHKIIEKQITYSEATNDIKDLRSHPCPDFVHPDYQNKDYAIYELDPISLKNLSTFLPLMPSEASRFNLLVMSELMIKSEKFLPEDFFKALALTLERKNSEAFLQYLKQTSVIYMHSHYFTKKEKDSLAELFEEKISSAIKNSNSIEVKYNLIFWYLQFGRSDNFKKLIEESLNVGSLFNVTLDSFARWHIIRILGKENLIEKEIKLDRSPVAASQLQITKVATNNLELKKQQWQNFISIENLKELNPVKVNSAQFFHDSDHPEISLNFVDEYFSLLEELQTKNQLVQNLFFYHLYPHTLCQEDIYKKSKSFREKNKTLDAAALQMWEKAENDLALCIKIRSKK